MVKSLDFDIGGFFSEIDRSLEASRSVFRQLESVMTSLTEADWLRIEAKVSAAMMFASLRYLNAVIYVISNIIGTACPVDICQMLRTSLGTETNYSAVTADVMFPTNIITIVIIIIFIKIHAM